MKKTILGLLAATTIFSCTPTPNVAPENFLEVQTTPTAASGAADNEFITASGILKNNSGQSLNLAWNINTLAMTGCWKGKVVFTIDGNEESFDVSSSSSSGNVVRAFPNGSTMTVAMKFSANGATGVGNVSMNIFQAGSQSTTSKTLVFSGNATAPTTFSFQSCEPTGAYDRGTSECNIIGHIVNHTNNTISVNWTRSDVNNGDGMWTGVGTCEEGGSCTPSTSGTITIAPNATYGLKMQFIGTMGTQNVSGYHKITLGNDPNKSVMAKYVGTP